LPKSNVDYWLPKLARNVERDREADRDFRDAGWTVLRFWEHDDPEAVATAIASALTGTSVKTATENELAV